MRSLVVYYSLGGITRKLAETLAKDLGADIAEVRCSRYGRGAMGFLTAVYDSVTGRSPQIAIAHAPLQSYDAVFVGGPVWAGHAAAPLRTYLQDRRGQFKRVGFFLTFGGSPGARALPEMNKFADATAEATLTLSTAQVMGGKAGDAVAAFLQPFKMKAAA